MDSRSTERRAFLKLGALTIGGPLISAAGNADTVDFGKCGCIFMLLQGGPSHLDLWDPKPESSAEIRGPFSTTPSAIPGVRLGELLTRTAPLIDRLAIIRSMTHQFTNHIAGTYVTLTGSDDQPNTDREAHEDDFPGPGAILNYLGTSVADVPRAVSLPNWLSIPGPSNRMPGQYGGFLGNVYDPFLLEGDPQKPDYRPLSLDPPAGFGVARLDHRLELVRRLDASSRGLENELGRRYDRLRESAYRLVADGRLRNALDLGQESEAVRSRYGDTKIGQSLLLARRLREVGVQFVSVNAFNQEWDTHGGLEGRYRQIVPPVDQAYSALIEDLGQRGMLDQTLVVHTGEFGRTPKINNGAGRDHWPNAYSTVLAGGGVQGGVVWGETDRHGSEVLQDAVTPADVLATMWRQLGVAPHSYLNDRVGRPHPVSSGRVLQTLLG